MRKLFIIGFRPLFQSLFKLRNTIEFTSPDKIFFQGSNHPLRIRITFRIAVTGEYLLDIEFGTGFQEGEGCRLTAMIADQIRNPTCGSNPLGKLEVHRLIQGVDPIGRLTGQAHSGGQELFCSPVQNDM
ncbi:hypothetical protein SDC9_195770 [bioreactor metagenome]|uniref:Uncharacterized protein n=1 Tax=bioreactor metagenome TaxID=1076179 RepID=A0A645I9Z4_9ZZZZ